MVKEQLARSPEEWYETTLPWKPNHPELPNNEHGSIKRLTRLTKKLLWEHLTDASDEVIAQRQAQVQQRNKEIEDINERNNSVWCHIALALDKTSLMYIRHDCLSQDGTGDGAKAWRLLQQRYSNVEKPTVVSLVRQISRLQLGEEEKLHEYFIRAQELMSRLSDAGEKISETLFNALVINSLPEKYEHFVVQESFNPALTFTENPTAKLRGQSHTEKTGSRHVSGYAHRK